jgi:ubiquitin-protein ligase
MQFTFILPAGQRQLTTVSDNTRIAELLPSLLAALKLPKLSPDGSAISYALLSKSLERVLEEDETLALVPQSDELIITADLTAAASLSDSPRVRRLRGDYERMMELAARSDLIEVKALDVSPGMPPERYIVTYKVKSVVGIDKNGKPKMASRHQVEIYLHNDYPHRWPGLKWLTPIWHPNINHVNGSVCIDVAWWGAARSLDRLVIMMGEMLEYKNFHDDPNTAPFPWDKEAAAWCRDYRKAHPDFVPTDSRELLRPERVKLDKKKTSKPRITLKS